MSTTFLKAVCSLPYISVMCCGEGREEREGRGGKGRRGGKSRGEKRGKGIREEEWGGRRVGIWRSGVERRPIKKNKQI